MNKYQIQQTVQFIQQTVIPKEHFVDTKTSS